MNWFQIEFAAEDGGDRELAFPHMLAEAALRDASVREQAEQLTARRSLATAPAHAALEERLG